MFAELEPAVRQGGEAWERVRALHPKLSVIDDEVDESRVLAVARSLAQAGDPDARTWLAEQGALWLSPGGKLEGQPRSNARIQPHPEGILAWWKKEPAVWIWNARSGAVRELCGHRNNAQGAVPLDDGGAVVWSDDAVIRAYRGDSTEPDVMISRPMVPAEVVALPDGSLATEDGRWSLAGNELEPVANGATISLGGTRLVAHVGSRRHPKLALVELGRTRALGRFPLRPGLVLADREAALRGSREAVRASWFGTPSRSQSGGRAAAPDAMVVPSSDGELRFEGSDWVFVEASGDERWRMHMYRVSCWVRDAAGQMWVFSYGKIERYEAETLTRISKRVLGDAVFERALALEDGRVAVIATAPEPDVHIGGRTVGAYEVWVMEPWGEVVHVLSAVDDIHTLEQEGDELIAYSDTSTHRWSLSAAPRALDVQAPSLVRPGLEVATPTGRSLCICFRGRRVVELFAESEHMFLESPVLLEDGELVYLQDGWIHHAQLMRGDQSVGVSALLGPDC